jgi:chemotaxis protein MotA
MEAGLPGETMNFSMALGFIAAIGVFLHAVFNTADNPSVFYNEGGLVIVIGGTLAAAIICFPIKKIFNLSWVALKKMLFGSQIDYGKVIRQIIDIGEKLRTNPTYLKTEVHNIKEPFLKEAIALVNDGFTEDQIVDVMEQRIQTHAKRYAVETNMFRALSKFPPAFGLMGTTLGMIALLQQLGAADAASRVGPAMAIGLVATLYGIALANLILIPIAENLAEKTREDQTLREIILEGVILLKQKAHPIMIAEKLNSFLLPSERSDLQVNGGNSDRERRKRAA